MHIFVLFKGWEAQWAVVEPFSGFLSPFLLRHRFFFRASLAPTPVSRSVNCSVSQKHFQILASICERDICPFHKWVAPELQETILGKWLNIDILALGNQKLILIFKSLKSLSGVGESEIQWWLFLLQQDFLQGVNVWPWITMETMDDKETMDEKTKIVMNHLENTFKEWPIGKRHLTSVAIFTFEHKMLTFLTFKNLKSWHLKST